MLRSAPQQFVPSPRPIEGSGRLAVSGPKDQVVTVRTYAEAMPFEKDWSIQIVPPQYWKGPVSGPSDHPPHAYSDLKSRITYLRGDVLHDLSPYAVQRILAHELGHLTANTEDEGRANKWADNYMKQVKP